MKNQKLDQLQKNISILEEEIQNQKNIINEYREGLEASIRCAESIQQAMLPSTKILDEYINENFILYKPRDVISGDFYWFGNLENKRIIAVGDCTGHGVPAGLISMLGISSLNQTINHKKINHPSNILSELRVTIVESLQQKEYLASNNNGMDISIILLDVEEMVVEFAGANRPLYLIRNKELKIIKGDPMFIGFHVQMDPFTQTIFRYKDFTTKFLQEQDQIFPFTNHQIKLKKDDRLYLFSDGFADQFDNNNIDKFSSRAFKKLITEIHELPMSTQKEIFIDEFNNWKGDNQQTDDILVIGIQV